MEFTIKAKEIYLENEVLTDSTVVVEDGIIKAIGEVRGEVKDLGDVKLMPGFLDIHVHGGNGHDTMDCTHEAVKEISKFKIKEGVTSFCATTVTTSIEKTKNAIKNVDEVIAEGLEGAKIIGTFLEGPYINEKYKGAHPESYIRDIDLTEIEDLVNTGNVVSFAIAPDKDKAIDAIKMLKEKDINVRIGHSSATSEVAAKAIEAGSNIAIHVFNAMSPFTHREIGMVGQIMKNDNIYGEIICDLIHVHPDAIKILVKQKGIDKVILVTDCMMAGGLKDGNYNLGELPVKVEDSIARTMDGALAGSTLSVMKAVENMHKVVGVSLSESVKMATINPAKALGVDDKVGSIAVNKCADFVALDDAFNIKFVMVDGEVRL